MRDCGTVGLLSDVDTVELWDLLAEGRPTPDHLWPSQQAHEGMTPDLFVTGHDNTR